MPELTRRRDNDSTHQESWHIYWGDVCIGWIGERTGVPKDEDQWGWSCGFYPPAHLGQVTGTAADFPAARADFEAAWRDYLPKCTQADFDAWRFQHAFTAWKYAMWAAGCKMPTQTVDGRAKCFCGAVIDNKSSLDHIRACHMEVAA